MVFDGRKFAAEIEAELPRIRTKLMVVLDTGNLAGKKYVERKRQVAERLGVTMEVVDRPQIENWNVDPAVGGIMIQLPFSNTHQLIELIDPKKDVDGMREDSLFMPATVRAVKHILNHELGIMSYEKLTVVGSRGVVGKGLMKWLPGASGMDAEDFDPAALATSDVVISATGQAGLIKPEMVRDGAAAIDVGYPKGDFDPAVALKARFFTPVPGGVGPVTVVMLFANLADGILGK